jgi:curved DNA-binding protein CbpA
VRSVAARFDPYAVLSIPRGADDGVIRAAYRALAWRNHPDLNSSPDSVARMSEINTAYGLVRTADARRRLDAERAASGTAAASTGTPPAPPADASTVSFGRYAGWTIEQLARHDPDYLRWLSRHSAGQPYRREIADRLGAAGRRVAPSRPTPPPRRRWGFVGG